MLPPVILDAEAQVARNLNPTLASELCLRNFLKSVSQTWFYEHLPLSLGPPYRAPPAPLPWHRTLRWPAQRRSPGSGSGFGWTLVDVCSQLFLCNSYFL